MVSQPLRRRSFGAVQHRLITHLKHILCLRT
jgi:hypothetical protein